MWLPILLALAVGGWSPPGQGRAVNMVPQDDARVIPLPEPRTGGEGSVESALRERRSVREYSDESITLAELSQLLWAAQGVTGSGGRRTAPSAGALYPLEIHLLTGNVEDLEVGLYRYVVGGHALVRTVDVDLRSRVADAALGQEWMAEAAAVIVIGGVVERSAVKYGQRAVRYVHMEVGAAAQNVYLQAEALGLGTVFVGAFSDTGVAQVLGLPPGEQVFAILPVGRPE